MKRCVGFLVMMAALGFFPSTGFAKLTRFEDYFKDSKLGVIHKKESPGFVVSWVHPRDEIFVDALLSHLEAADSQLSPLFRDASGATHKKVPVEIFPDLRTFAAVSELPYARFKATGTIALTLDQRLMILSPRNLLAGYSWAVTVVHEYTHYLIREITADYIPIWLHEGTAQFYQGYPQEKVTDLRPSQWGLFKRSREKKQLLSLETLKEPFPYRKTPEEAELAYVQSLLFVKWLDKKCGILNVIRSAGAKKDLEAALSQCSKMSMRELNAAFVPKILAQVEVPKRKDVEFFARDFSGADPVEVESRKTDRRHKNFAQLSTELFHQGRWSASAIEMEKALRDEGAAPPSWRRQLSMSYSKSGQDSRAYGVLEELLKDYPEDASAWFLLAANRMQHASTAEAWRALSQAFFINPFMEGLEDAIHQLQQKDPKLKLSL